jgi:ribonuclease BN (tRNA processing enzyme)
VPKKGLTVRVLGPYGGSAPGRPMTTFLINGATSLDAGALTFRLPLAEQRRVRRIVLSHAHFDHVASLPFLVENVFGAARRPIELAAPAPVLAALKDHLFNDAVWPDFSRLPSARRPIFRFVELVEEKPYLADGISFTPVAVRHIVPTYGYLISRGGATIAFSGDTGPTERIWEMARREPHLRAVFLEVSFHNALRGIARASQHLTPALVRKEVAKLPESVPVYLYHMKPRSLARIRTEIRALKNRRLRVLSPDQRLRF